jgi:serine/threonine-protein kinase
VADKPDLRALWQSAGPYLDRALDMNLEDRARFMASLAKQDPSAAQVLRMFLDEHRVIADERFLEDALPFAPQPTLAGQGIGAYTLVSRIGEGGMGSVWLAERTDGRFERRVAVKLLNDGLTGGSAEQRFRREGAILGRLAHPHIAEMMDAGVSTAGQLYLVLEYVEGKHIDRYCEDQKLDIEARLRLFQDVLNAVAHAHTNLIVHRDIKPSNVLVRDDGQVKLLDFGIATLIDAEATKLTREGAGPLTPEYAAPEQVTGGAVTTATDVYALGVLLYLLLTGKHPVGPGPHSPATLVKAIIQIDPAPPSQAAGIPAGVRRTLAGDLDTIVMSALKKDPQERYASVTALADDLRRYLTHEPIRARPETFPYRARKFLRRNRTPVVVAAIVFMAIGLAAAAALIQARTARAERDFAYRQLSRAESINDLNSFLLSDAAPLGKPFKVTDLLTRAEQIIGHQQENDVDRKSC